MPDRIERYRKGHAAEKLAAWWLRLKGYRICARRYKTPHGEIDLVACRGRVVAFVEVKARASRDAGLLAISPQAQRRIQNAALHFMARHPALAGRDWRFDAVVVRSRCLPYHLSDAWRPEN